MGKKGDACARLAAKHRLEECLKCLPKQNKALCNPFIQTPLYVCCPELTAVWDCTSSQITHDVSSVCMCCQIYRRKKKRNQRVKRAKCIQE